MLVLANGVCKWCCMCSYSQADSEKTQKSERNKQKMASAALASWQLVVDETKNETNCSPLPPNKHYSKIREQKIVADLLQNNSFHKDKSEEERSHFSARRFKKGE